MLLVWAIVLTVLSPPLLYHIKPRLPLPRTSTPRPFDLSFLRHHKFWLLQAGNMLQGLGYFIPAIYLPTFARSLLHASSSTSTSSLKSTTPLILLNTTSVLGQILLGSLSDSLNVTTVILISAIGTTIAVFVLWGLSSSSFPLLCIFGLAYGLFAGGFSATWPGILRELRREHRGTEAGLVIGLLSAGGGVESLSSGPLSEALLKARPWEELAGKAYENGYGGLIVFTGFSAALSGLGLAGRRVGWI